MNTVSISKMGQNCQNRFFKMTFDNNYEKITNNPGDKMKDFDSNKAGKQSVLSTDFKILFQF